MTDVLTFVDKFGRTRLRKTHCKSGHPYDDVNTYWHINWRGYKCRGCRTCVLLAMRKRRQNPEVLKQEAEKVARWRAKDPEHANKLWRDNRWVKKEWLDSQKTKCARCPETHIACLEFHHRDPKRKKFLLSVAVARYSLDRIKQEVAKCDVICSNCHRKHHWEERQQKVSEGV